MIPIFPEFKNIEISDKEEIENFTKDFPPYSQFHFVTLFCWDVQEKRMISMLNGNLVVKTTDDLSGETFYTFLGTNDAHETIMTLLKISHREKIRPVLNLIPQETANKFFDSDKDFRIKEDRNNFDYIYSINDLKNYSGPKYAQSRNLLSRFHRRYLNYEVKLFSLTKEDDLRCFNEVWNIWNYIKEGYIEKEEIAIKRFLKNISHFELVNVMIYVDDKPVAFTINQIINGEFAIAHFAKANYAYSGVTSAIMNETAKQLDELGCKYLNYEEDLGLQPLRKAKQSYQPVSFLKKYTVEEPDLLRRLLNVI